MAFTMFAASACQSLPMYDIDRKTLNFSACAAPAWAITPSANAPAARNRHPVFHDFIITLPSSGRLASGASRALDPGRGHIGAEPKLLFDHLIINQISSAEQGRSSNALDARTAQRYPQRRNVRGYDSEIETTHLRLAADAGGA